MNKKYPLAFLLPAAALAAVLVPLSAFAAEPHGAEEKPHAPASPPPGVVALSAAARENLGIVFAKVESRAVARTLRLPGFFEETPGSKRVVAAGLSGEVRLKVRVQDRVAAGQAVAELVSPAWREWRARHAEAKAQVLLAEAEEVEAKGKLAVLEKHQAELKAIGSTHAEFTLEAQSVRLSLPTKAAQTALAKAKLSALEEQMAPFGGPSALCPVIRAENDGVVESLGVSDGAFVESSATVLTLLGVPRFTASVPQTQVPAVKAGLPARVAPPPGESGGAFAGTLRLALTQDPATRALPVFVEANAIPAWVRAGQAGWLEIELPGSVPKALAIPESALVKDGTELVFFRRNPRKEGEVKRVVADLGASDGAWVEVKSGVAEGDEVIAKGAYAVGLAASASGASSKAPAGYHYHGDGTLHKDGD